MKRKAASMGNAWMYGAVLSTGGDDWASAVQSIEDGSDIEYAMQKQQLTQEDMETYQNFCRPGFLIIGQGKCGTSSLYHYLVGHPRVLPASEKQIHYFKYYARYGFKWYMGHFPTAQSFMAHGALMTGEASPGYLPYPDVVALTKKEMPGTKIICVGRDPLGRSWSSYRYNYVNPALEIMRKGKAPGIARNMSDEYYQKYLYSFEEMLRAELKTIKACLAPGGPGEVGARERWGREPWEGRYLPIARGRVYLRWLTLMELVMATLSRSVFPEYSGKSWWIPNRTGS
ncbi:hypothetical protein MHU86_11048 [Fragilaria crotonensis]|nr:hypothetical protein MHU86_11048 [Fragilaria crotonensis]